MTSREEVQQLLGEIFGVEPAKIVLDAGPDEIDGWDSLGHLNAVVALEERYGVSFSTDEIASMQSVTEILRNLHHHGIDVEWPA